MTRRERILAHLTDHPDLTAGEIARALGLPGPLIQLLRDMEAKAQVTPAKIWWPQQGRRVNVWRAAAPGTVPAGVIERRRELERLSRSRTRARGRGLNIPPGAACCGADPELLFSRRRTKTIPGPVRSAPAAGSGSSATAWPPRPARKPASGAGSISTSPQLTGRTKRHDRSR